MENENIVKFLDWLNKSFESEYYQPLKDKDGMVRNSTPLWINIHTKKKYTSKEVYEFYSRQSHINYDTITLEQVEEFVEVIDWAIIPSGIITLDLVKKYKNFKGIGARYWFEEIFSKMNFRMEGTVSHAYSDIIFYMSGVETMKMESKNLKVSNNIFQTFQSQYNIDFDEACHYIKSLFRMRFKIELSSVNKYKDNYSIDWHNRTLYDTNGLSLSGIRRKSP